VFMRLALGTATSPVALILNFLVSSTALSQMHELHGVA